MVQPQSPLPGQSDSYLVRQTGGLSWEGDLGKTDIQSHIHIFTVYIHIHRERGSNKNRSVLLGCLDISDFEKKMYPFGSA